VTLRALCLIQYKMKNILFAIILLSISSPSLACKGTEYDWVQTLNTRKHTVKGPFTIKEMESDNLIRINKTWLPFGNQNNEWIEMKSIFKKGDTFYSVNFENSRWIIMQHFLIRDNCIIKKIVVAVS